MNLMIRDMTGHLRELIQQTRNTDVAFTSVFKVQSRALVQDESLS